MSCFCFFFFQAEDGIRDKLVTGVQTCALPISPLLHVRLDRGGQRLPAGIRGTTGSSGARGRELAERALPGASSRRVRHIRRAIPPLPPPPAPDCCPAMGPPRTGTAW